MSKQKEKSNQTKSQKPSIKQSQFSSHHEDYSSHNERRYNSQQHHHHEKRHRRPPQRETVAFSKDQYLAGHFHFELNDLTGIITNEVDELTDWLHVEQVTLSTNDSRSCPICLDHPIAAKITRCGHIFCSQCIYHYLSLSRHSWSRCPLCFEPVYPQALKSLKYRLHDRIEVGSSVDFTLIARDKHDNVLIEISPAPVRPDAVHMDRNHALTMNSITDPTLFTRITHISDISSIVERELKELAKQAVGLSESIEMQFILFAQEQIHQRIDNWLKHHPDQEPRLTEIALAGEREIARIQRQHHQQAQQALSPPAPKKIVDTSDEKQFPSLASIARPTVNKQPINQSANQSQPSQALQAKSPTLNASAPSFTPGATNETPKHSSNQTTRRIYPADTHFFYQARDGQQVYLHNLTYRALLHEYGSPQSLPPLIRANIEFIDSVVMDQTQRDKNRFLSHLPLSTTYQFVILDIDSISPPLSDETVARFIGEYEAEQNRRSRRVKQLKAFAKRREKQAREEDESFEAPNEWDWIQPDETPPDLVHGVDQFPALHMGETPQPVPVRENTQPKPTQWNILAGQGLAASGTWQPLSASRSSPTHSVQPASISPKPSASRWGRPVPAAQPVQSVVPATTSPPLSASSTSRSKRTNFVPLNL